jgi:exodeoxyribonuclease VIII
MTHKLTLEWVNDLYRNGLLKGIFQLDEAVYRAAPGVSQSLLKEFKYSAAHAKASMDGLIEPTKAQELGTAIHTLVLEPEVFKNKYCVAPDIKRNSNAGKEAYAEWATANAGKIPLTVSDITMCSGIANQVETSAAGEMLKTSLKELSFFWTDSETGVFCKGRLDAYTAGIIFDLKTTSGNATSEDFGRAVANFGYHIQAAFYLDGLEAAAASSPELSGAFKVDRFLFIVAEKAAPYGVSVMELAPEDIELGRARYKQYLAEYSVCKAENHWPSYSNVIQTVRVPKWA